MMFFAFDNPFARRRQNKAAIAERWWSYNVYRRKIKPVRVGDYSLYMHKAYTPRETFVVCVTDRHGHKNKRDFVQYPWRGTHELDHLVDARAYYGKCLKEMRKREHRRVRLLNFFERLSGEANEPDLGSQPLEREQGNSKGRNGS